MADDELVSPAELSALLDSAPTAAKRPGRGGGVEPYDLTDRMPLQDGTDLPALQRVTEYFCEGLSRALTVYLGRETLVSSRGAQTQEFREFVHGLPARASICGLEMAPLACSAALALDPSLIFAVVESFFGGGRATPGPANRDLTPTERRMLGSLLDLLIPELQAAWAPVLPLQMSVASSDVDPLLVSLIDPAEMVLVHSYEVAVLGGGGDFRLAIPLPALQGVWPTLRGGVPAKAPDDSGWRSALTSRVLQSPLSMRAIVAEKVSSLRQVLGLQTGDVLVFDRDENARLEVDGRALFIGEFGVSNGSNAVSVTRRLKRGGIGETGGQS
ncbi:flagellar motor switch protein FliM [Immundisolibacter sp.]|uniref:flagellar motor switch protein FliM n=1 Tax=Immundisolibacter sp. TaxID=1934948 RepID=UPI003565ED2B